MPSKRCATSAKGNGNCSSAAVTDRMASQSRCEIQVQASQRRISTACSRLSIARNRTVWDLGCRSAGRLSKRITDDCGRALTCPVALSLALLHRLIRPPFNPQAKDDSRTLMKARWSRNSPNLWDSLQQVMGNLIVNAIQAMSGIGKARANYRSASMPSRSKVACASRCETPVRVEPFYTTKPEGGHGPLDLPLDHRSPWRTAVGDLVRTTRCSLSGYDPP